MSSSAKPIPRHTNDNVHKPQC